MTTKMRYAPTAALAGWLCLNLVTAVANAQAAATDPNPGDEKPLELSPFTVNADADTGYVATQTLSGTRLNTSLRDIGSAVTILTDEFLNDIAATSAAEMLEFVPNTFTFHDTFTDTVGHGNDFLNNALQYVTRGGSTGAMSRDFFSLPVQDDRFSTEQITFARGPNAILFGLGNPNGILSTSSKRARFVNSHRVEVKFDNHGTERYVLDVNRSLVRDRLAFRFAALREDSKTFRNPSGGHQRRVYGTVTAKPLPATTLRVHAEQGKSKVLAVRPWPTYDNLSAWIAAGQPTTSTFGAPRPAGVSAAYNNNTIVSTQYSPAGTIVPTFNASGTNQSANLTFPNFPNQGGLRSLVNPEIFPVAANVIGEGSSRHADFEIVSAFVEQRIGRNLDIELAFNRVSNDSLINNSFVGNFDRVYADVNQRLPSGAPNPNLGMLYVDSFGTIIPGRIVNNTFRATAAYDLRPAELMPRWGRFLGRHRLAAFYEDRGSDSRGLVNLQTRNVTPLPGFNNDIRHAQNRVFFRYYLDPERGIVSAGRDLTRLIPHVVYAGDPMPESDPSGVTTAFIAHQPGHVSFRGVSSRMVAMQNYFWRDRIVTSFGWRTDDVTDYAAGGANFFTPYLDSRGLAPDTRAFSARRNFPDTRSESSSNNSTRGVVFHALPWLSFSYNQSTNFAVGTGWRNVYGHTLPNPTGRGKDYGVKFALLRDKLVGNVIYYQERRTDRADMTVSQGLHGNFQNVINSIWGAIAREENKPEYNNFPYASGFNTWQDTSTGASSGVELSLTYNATPSWRMTFNATKRGEDTTEDRGAHIKAYLAEFLPMWKGNAQWMSYLINDASSGTNARTVGGAVQDLENILANFDALNGVTANTLLAPAWSFNYVTNYHFPRDSFLRGVGVGGSAQFRGKAIIGFAEGAAQVFDTSRPYYGKQFETYGAWVSYTRKIFQDKVRWRIQLNVRNLLGQNTLLPLRTIDSRDGNGTPAVIKYRLADGRGFITTSSFDF